MDDPYSPGKDATYLFEVSCSDGARWEFECIKKGEIVMGMSIANYNANRRIFSPLIETESGMITLKQKLAPNKFHFLPKITTSFHMVSDGRLLAPVFSSRQTLSFIA